MYIKIILGFLIVSLYLHRVEIINKDYIYSDNFYHYVIYSFIDKEILNKDIIVNNISNSTFKNISFNPLSLYIYKTLLIIFPNPKNVSLLIGILVQFTFSIFLFKFLREFLSENNKVLIFKLSLIGTIFFSFTDVFFGDLRRNFAFLSLSAAILNFYLNKKISFIFYLILYLFFYPVSFHSVSTLIFVYIFLKSDTSKKMKILILILFLIFNSLLLFIPKDIKEKILLSFDWKNDFGIKDLNFLEIYVFNFNEYFEIYRLLFYFTLITTIMMIIFINNSNNETKKIKKQTLILIVVCLYSFIFTSIIFSYSLASRQIVFFIPLLLLIMFLHQIYISSKKFNFLINFFLIFYLSFFILNKTEHQYTKVELDVMKKIEEKTTLNDLLLVHPEDFFVPYFTKRNTFVVKKIESIAGFIGKELFNEVIRRYEIATDIFYTHDLKLVYEIIKKEKIDYILVNRIYYSNDYIHKNKGPYYKLKEIAIKKYYKNKNKNFIIEKIAQKEGEILNKDYYLISAKKIKYIYETTSKN